jgi:hypothetical protein
MNYTTNSSFTINLNVTNLPLKIANYNNNITGAIALGWRINDSNKIYDDSNITSTVIAGSSLIVNLNRNITMSSIISYASLDDAANKTVIRDSGWVSLPVIPIINQEILTLASEMDSVPPNVTNLIEPSDPSVYASGASYKFNATILDDSGMGGVLFQFNGTNYSTTNVSSNYTVSLSSLSAGTYSYLWYANDSSGNVNNSESGTFTVSAATADTEDEDVQGNANLNPVFWFSTYTEDSKELKDKGILVKEIASRERMRVKISGETHYVGVISFNLTKAVINVSSKPQQIVLGVGESAKFNLDSNEYYDLKVEVNNITANKVKISLIAINEKINSNNLTSINNTLSKGDSIPGPVENKEISKRGEIIAIVLVIIVIGIAAGYFAIKKIKNIPPHKRWRKS